MEKDKTIYPEYTKDNEIHDLKDIISSLENKIEKLKNQLSISRLVGQSEQLKAFVEWWHGLSQEELVWHEGKYVEVFLSEQLRLNGIANFVYVVTERDNYGEQLFKGVFANREKAVEFLAEHGLKESNIDEINKIEL